MERGRVLENARGEKHKKVRLKSFPIDGAQAGDRGFDRHALHIEDQLVADFRVEVLRDLAIERNGNGVAGMIIDAPNPAAFGDFLRVRQLLPVGAPVLPLEFPLRNFSLRVGEDVHRFPSFDFRQPHRHDGRFLNDRHSSRSHDFRDASFLIRLNVEEENVRLVLRADGLELREQDLAAEIKIQKEKSAQA